MPNSHPPTEQWIRVVCHLPNNTKDEAQAIDRIVGYVQRLKDSTSKVTGFTQTNKFPGQWWSPVISKWVEDDVTLLIVDFAGSSDDALLMWRIARIRLFAFACYKFFDPKHIGQDEIWLMQHTQTRFC